MVGLGVEVVIEDGLLVAVGFDMGALGSVAENVRTSASHPAIDHKARTPAVGDEPPIPVDLA